MAHNEPTTDALPPSEHKLAQNGDVGEDALPEILSAFPLLSPDEFTARFREMEAGVLKSSAESSVRKYRTATGEGTVVVKTARDWRRLLNEAAILVELERYSCAIPKPLFLVRKSNALVLDLVGPSLYDLALVHHMRFSLADVIEIGVALLDALQLIHGRGVAHRDISPSNCCLASPLPEGKVPLEFRALSESERRVRWIDFGLAAHWSYIDMDEPDDLDGFGSGAYMSVRAHSRKARTRRDDLESLAYMLIWLARGSLPWMPWRGDEPWLSECIRTKQFCDLDELCSELPGLLKLFVASCRGLQPTDSPPYDELRQLLRLCAPSTSSVGVAASKEPASSAQT